MNEPREPDIKRLVVDHYDALPQQQKVVADYILAHLQEVPFLSVPELADRSGASEATIVRFAQRIGFDGYAALKEHLLAAVRERVALPSGAAAELFARVPQDDTLRVVATQEIGNIEGSVNALDRETFGQAATMLYRADHVYAFGMGISSHLADLTTYMLTQIGLRATTLSLRFSSPLEPLVALRPSDCLFVYSFPPYSRATIEMMREAADRGIPCLAVTDRLTSPAAQLARVVLPVRSENMMYTNSVAAVSVLVNALATEIALRHQDRAAAAVTRITRILAQDKDTLGEGR
ncbi:MAG TPA: MurR/RpiR family transcriptional regulator [Acidobacteriota bacterium]|nr:MurR/RpiR family transcriptional regulator [Acidobacteriota bacterium]